MNSRVRPAAVGGAEPPDDNSASNTARVQEIRADPHGDYDVVLTDGRTLRMSRTFRDRLLGR